MIHVKKRQDYQPYSELQNGSSELCRWRHAYAIHLYTVSDSHWHHQLTSTRREPTKTRWGRANSTQKGPKPGSNQVGESAPLWDHFIIVLKYTCQLVLASHMWNWIYLVGNKNKIISSSYVKVFVSKQEEAIDGKRLLDTWFEVKLLQQMWQKPQFEHITLLLTSKLPLILYVMLTKGILWPL